MDTLKARIEKELGWKVMAPEHEQTVELGG
jgi:hypothetical protein